MLAGERLETRLPPPLSKTASSAQTQPTRLHLTSLLGEVLSQFLSVWDIVSKEEVVTSGVPAVVVEADHMEVT